MEIRDFDTAYHEAAHVVVGVAAGLRLKSARIATIPAMNTAGEAWFHPLKGAAPRRREALALMLAAGIASDRVVRAPSWWHDFDVIELRKCVSGRHGATALVRAATAMLAALAPEHARVTRALLERDLTGSDLEALARGEKIE